MRTLAGSNSQVCFTHLSQSSCSTLTSLFSEPSNEARVAEAPAHAQLESVTEHMKKENISLHKVCLLDPRAELELSPADGDGRFSWFLFGVSSCGIMMPGVSGGTSTVYLPVI